MKTSFIKTKRAYNPEFGFDEPCPRFRRRFTVEDGIVSATLSVCGLGYGEYYLNGKIVTEDKFIAPFSDYNKTLWYNEYDVTELLKKGENVAAVMLGYGFFNENHKTAWDHNTAVWRDVPKFTFQLTIDYGTKKQTVLSDDTWKCNSQSFITFSQLRSGEYADLRLLDDWISPDYDDSNWDNAIIDDRAPTGVMRRVECSPIRECEIYKPVKIMKQADNIYVFDIGQNICGYPRINICGKEGQELIIRYSEHINPDSTRNLVGLDMLNFEAPFQTDRLILSGKQVEWSPKFVYHGFRYIEIEGLCEAPDENTVCGVFVHQLFDARTTFECSDENITRLFKMGQMSVWGNMCYMPTDCPTREKYGWTNDARASSEQFLLNFELEEIMEKWMQDIKDSMREDGALPGIIPTPGWGYDCYCGPITSGILYELPLREYLVNHNSLWLTENIDLFLKHLDYIATRKNENGLIEYGLCDYAGPYENFDASPVPIEFSDTALYINFMQITRLAMQLSGDTRITELEKRMEDTVSLFKAKFIGTDGRCTVDEQSALALMIDFGIYDDINPLAKQLCEQIEKHNYHHYCGMLGLRHLFYALNKIGREDLVIRVLTSHGFPSYNEWIEERDATTLCEAWIKTSSYNHHMYSSFMAWLVQTLGGINTNVGYTPVDGDVIIAPRFVEGIDYCRVTFDGRYSVYWERLDDKIKLEISAPKGTVLQLKNAEPIKIDGTFSEIL